MIQIISWSEAAERIGELLESGQYATNVELEEAAGYERQNVAQSIWYLYHDLSDVYKRQEYFLYIAVMHYGVWLLIFWKGADANEVSFS